MSKRHTGRRADDWLVTTVTSTQEGFRVLVRGAVDLSNVWQLEDTLTRVGRQPDIGQVVVDLRNARFVALVGARAIATAAAEFERRHIHLRVTHANPLTEQMLGMLGMERLLDDRPPNDA